MVGAMTGPDDSTVGLEGLSLVVKVAMQADSKNAFLFYLFQLLRPSAGFECNWLAAALRIDSNMFSSTVSAIWAGLVWTISYDMLLRTGGTYLPHMAITGSVPKGLAPEALGEATLSTASQRTKMYLITRRVFRAAMVHEVLTK